MVQRGDACLVSDPDPGFVSVSCEHVARLVPCEPSKLLAALVELPGHVIRFCLIPHLILLHLLVHNLPDDERFGEGGEQAGLHPCMRGHERPVVVCGVSL